MSVRKTSLLFLLGEERYRQPRAVYKYWAPCRLCCVEIFFIVNYGHWFCHPRGTLLMLEAITLVQLTPAFLVYVIFPLRLFDGDGFSDVLTAHGPSCLAATFFVSSPEEYSYAEFSGRSLPETFRIQRYLVRQRILVCVSSRGAWFDGAANRGCPAVAFHRWLSASLSCRRDRSPWSCLFGRP